MSWTFKEIDKHVKTEFFDCDAPALNEYLCKYARQNHVKGLGKTFVSVNDEDCVLGYYTISSAQVKAEELPEKVKKKLPKYPVPAIRIARLAVDNKGKGQGLGKELLMHALENILDISAKIGVFLVVVDAKDEKAVNFYRKYGFVQFPEAPKTLFLPIESIPK